LLERLEYGYELYGEFRRELGDVWQIGQKEDPKSLGDP